MAYTSEASAAAASHDDCRCVVVGLYPGSEMAELAKVEREKFGEQYAGASTIGGSGAVSLKETLRTWRKMDGSK